MNTEPVTALSLTFQNKEVINKQPKKSWLIRFQERNRLRKQQGKEINIIEVTADWLWDKRLAEDDRYPAFFFGIVMSPMLVPIRLLMESYRLSCKLCYRFWYGEWPK